MRIRLMTILLFLLALLILSSLIFWLVRERKPQTSRTSQAPTYGQVRLLPLPRASLPRA